MTLIEVLVVIAIIAILAGFALPRITPPRPTSAAQLVSGVTENSRVDAIRAGSRSRIAINIDTAAGDNYLREIIALIDEDQDPTTNDWKITSRKVLPQGLLLMDEFSGTLVGSALEMSIDSSELSIQDGTSGSPYKYHEFNSLGRSEASSQWVFSRGEVNGNGSEPAFVNEADRTGFIIRKTGKTAFFSDASQITTLSSP